MARMQRTQRYLEPELTRAQDRLARKRRTSRGQLLRLATWRLLQEEQQPAEDPILGIVGLGRSGHTDVSVEHDRYLEKEYFESHHGRLRRMADR